MKPPLPKPKPKPAAKPPAKPPAKPSAKAPAKAPAGKSGNTFKWPGDKKNRHSISYGQHKTNAKTMKEVGTLDFAQPVDPQHALGEVNAASALKYGQQESDLNNMVRDSGVQQGNITNWFDQYKADLDQTKAAQASYIQGQVAANTAVAAQAGGQTQFAPGTDASVVAAEQQGAKNRESQVKTLGAAISAAGAAENNYLANRKNVGSAAQLGARVEEGRNLQKIKREQSSLSAEKGAFKTTELGKIRDRERQYGLESTALGIKRSDAKADAKHQRNQDATARKNTTIKETAAQTTKRNADRTYQLNVKKQGAAAAKDAYQRTHKTGPYAPGAKGKGAKPKDNSQTSAQRQAFHDDVGSTKAVVARLKGSGKDRHTVAMSVMSDPKNKGELATSIALDLAYDGAVSKANVEKAHAAGLAIGSLPTQTQRRKATRKAHNTPAGRTGGN